MWQKFHILSRGQVFLVSSISGAAIAIPFALASMGRYGTPFLGWPHQFDPLVNFGSVFLSVLPVFLGYYHLGRLGALLSLPISAVTWFGSFLCALFVLQGHPEVAEIATYVSFCLLVGLLVFAMHVKAAESPAIQRAQRSLRLTRYPQTR